MFTMRPILENYWEQNIDVYHLVTDFQAAYVTVLIKQMWSEMHGLCFPPHPHPPEWFSCSEF
jgi:hypothetical protein